MYISVLFIFANRSDCDQVPDETTSEPKREQSARNTSLPLQRLWPATLQVRHRGRLLFLAHSGHQLVNCNCPRVIFMFSLFLCVHAGRCSSPRQTELFLACFGGAFVITHCSVMCLQARGHDVNWSRSGRVAQGVSSSPCFRLGWRRPQDGPDPSSQRRCDSNVATHTLHSGSLSWPLNDGASR